LPTSCSIVRRVAGGKTLEVVVEVDDECCVRRVVVGGDFFAFPEDAIDRVEGGVVGCCSADCIAGRVRRLLWSVVLVGVDVNSIVSVLGECYGRLCVGRSQ
jgi:hypothetical protein